MVVQACIVCLSYEDPSGTLSLSCLMSKSSAERPERPIADSRQQSFDTRHLGLKTALFVCPCTNANVRGDSWAAHGVDSLMSLFDDLHHAREFAFEASAVWSRVWRSSPFMHMSVRSRESTKATHSRAACNSALKLPIHAGLLRCTTQTRYRPVKFICQYAQYARLAPYDEPRRKKAHLGHAWLANTHWD